MSPGHSHGMGECGSAVEAELEVVPFKGCNPRTPEALLQGTPTMKRVRKDRSNRFHPARGLRGRLPGPWVPRTSLHAGNVPAAQIGYTRLPRTPRADLVSDRAQHEVRAGAEHVRRMAECRVRDLLPSVQDIFALDCAEHVIGCHQFRTPLTYQPDPLVLMGRWLAGIVVSSGCFRRPRPLARGSIGRGSRRRSGPPRGYGQLPYSLRERDP